MRNKLSAIPFYPFLLSISFILTIYLKYIHIYPESLIIKAVIYSLMITFVYWCVLSFLIKDIHKRALYTASFVAMTVLYGNLGSFFEKIGLIGQLHSIQEFVIVMFVYMLVLLLFYKFKKVSPKVTILFNVVTIVMVVFSGINYISGKYKEKAFIDEYQNQQVETVVPENIPKVRPNIYHIILDEYPISEILYKEFHFDNTYFVDGLQDQGFYIVDKSHSNYSMTSLSTSSILNFRYLTDLEIDSYTKFGMRHIVQNLMNNNSVFSFLKKCGYTTILTPAIATQGKLFGADIEINGDYQNDYYRELIGNTPYRLFTHVQDMNYRAITSSVDIIKELPTTGDGPFIVFAHILSPHGPISFDKNGDYVSINESKRRTDAEEYREYYRNQLIGLNAMILELVQHILANSKEPPIILIQGDHGLRGRMRLKNEKLSPVTIFGNLNAMYLPGYNYDELRDDMSLVNTYRYIFNHFFGTDMEILEDKCGNLTEEYKQELAELHEEFENAKNEE